MRALTKGLFVLVAVASLSTAPAFAYRPSPFGDKPVSPQSLPADNLPPFNMLDAKGALIPMPKLDGPLHEGGGVESDAPGPNLAESVKMAQAAVAACKAKGFLVGATVVDSIGEARAALTADGSDGSHIFVAHRKALTALGFGMTSMQANADIYAGKAPKEKITANMFVMGGAVPIFKAGKLVGAIGVSGAAGAPPGKSDEDCAYAGLKAGGASFK